MDVLVYTKAKAGLKFSITDADHVKGPFVENIDVTFTGGIDLDNEPPASATLASNLVGPGKFKIKADSKSGRMSTDNALVVCNVYNN